MSRESWMKQVLDRVNQFTISSEDISHIIALYDRRNEPLTSESVKMEIIFELWDFLSSKNERELKEVIYLMDFGRSISNSGFRRYVIEDFIKKVDSGHFNRYEKREAVEILAGEPLLGNWLRLVQKELSEGMEPDDFYEILFDKLGEIVHRQDYDTEEEAWAALREMIAPETAEEYSLIHLRGCSYTGRIETQIVSVFFSM